MNFGKFNLGIDKFFSNAVKMLKADLRKQGF